MARILLADDSPIAQRLGERILREEGFDVVACLTAEETLSQAAHLSPDAFILDGFLPGTSGLDLSRKLRGLESSRHACILITGSFNEPVTIEQARDAGADGVLQKPFEASRMMGVVHTFLRLAKERKLTGEFGAAAPPPLTPEQDQEERVRNAVIAEVEQSLPRLVEEITRKVLHGLRGS